MPLRTHSAIREGCVAGFIGATAVAAWFLAIDSIAGRPFFTPELLGRALLSVLGPPFDDTALAVVWVYTIFHYAAFMVAGILATIVVHVAEREPSILWAALILFVIFEIGFHGLVALLQETTVLGALAWYQVMAGNLLAAGLMGTYLFKTHSALREEFVHALDYRD